MKTFRQILIEGVGSDYIENVIKAIQIQGLRWKSDFPEENVDVDFMRPEFDRSHHGIGFIATADKKGDVSKGSKALPKELKGRVACVAHGCFYNSLDYMHKFGHLNKKQKLAYGIMLDPRSIDEMKTAAAQDPLTALGYNSKTTVHAFILDGKKVIDPTLGRQPDYYFYKTVPENVWRKFNYKPNDSNWDARDFANFIHADIEKEQKKFPMEKRVRKIGGI